MKYKILICVMIVLVIYMIKNKELSKFDKISKNFLIVSCVILGSIFLAACAYMLTLINDANKDNSLKQKNSIVDNIDFVNM